MNKTEFVDKFLKNFATGIDKKQLKKIHISKSEGYLWHLFSNELISCFSGDVARQEYNKIDKNNAIEIQYDSIIGDNETILLQKEHYTAKRY